MVCRTSSSRISGRLSAWTLAFGVVALLLMGTAAMAFAGGGGFNTDDESYVNPVGANVEIEPILTVGEEVSRTADDAEEGEMYRMIGIPDGLGLHENADGTWSLWMNHELNKTVVSNPISGNQQISMTGAFVSEYVLSDTGILSGDFAYNGIYVDGELTEGAFARFCSGFLGSSAEGLDRPIYFAGEEASGSGTFDGRGGIGVAIFDEQAHTLPRLGRYAKENIVVLPNTGNRTVVFGLEDGPSSLDSQLYMYVGTKQVGATDVLAANGLNNGSLYVFSSTEAAHTDEATYHQPDGELAGEWVEIAGAEAMTDTQLNTATKAAGSFNFIRVEDGASDPNRPGVFYFATTGSGLTVEGGEVPTDTYVNGLGRLYQLTLDPNDPAGGAASLEILVENDLETEAAQTMVSPDNIGINAAGQIAIQEDPTDEGQAVLNEVGRDSSIWVYDTNNTQLIRVAEMNQAAVPEAMRGDPGEWETSGIIDASGLYGDGWWLFDVQAHTINDAEASELQGYPNGQGLVQGGQLLRMRLSAPTSVTLSNVSVAGSVFGNGWVVGLTALAAVAGLGLVLRRRSR